MTPLHHLGFTLLSAALVALLAPGAATTTTRGKPPVSLFARLLKVLEFIGSNPAAVETVITDVEAFIAQIEALKNPTPVPAPTPTPGPTPTHV